MTIAFYDAITFRFNSGRGITVDQIDGSIVTGVSDDGTGVIVRMADGTSQTLTVGGLTAEDRQLLRNAVQRVLVDVEQASEATVDKIVLRAGKGYLTEKIVTHAATPATATFVAFTDSHFWGYRNSDPPTSAASENQWYFNTLSHRARILVNINPVGPGPPVYGWTDASLDQIIPGAGVYRREWPDDAEAARKHIERVGDVYYNTSTGSLRRATAHTAATGQVVGNHLTRLLTEDDIRDFHGDGNVRVFQETGGTASAVTLTSKSGEALTEYGEKLVVIWKAAQAVPVGGTLNVDGLGARPLRDGTGTAIAANLILANDWVASVYNRANNAFDCFGVQPGRGGGGGEGRGRGRCGCAGGGCGQQSQAGQVLRLRKRRDKPPWNSRQRFSRVSVSEALEQADFRDHHRC